MSERAESLLDAINQTGHVDPYPEAERAVARSICEHLGLDWRNAHLARDAVVGWWDGDDCTAGLKAVDALFTLLEAAGIDP